MKYKMFSIRQIFVGSLFVFSAMGSSLFAQAVQHLVTSGETAYSISRKYGITIQQLLDSNKGLTAETLKAGVKLTIPAVTADGGIANSGYREMHKVKKGDTQYSIAKKYNVTMEDLVRANPEMAAAGYQLKKGSFIFIPSASAPQAVPAAAKTPAPATAKSVKPAQDKVSIAVLLPLKAQGEEGKRCLEFYRGFLMSTGEISDAGNDVVIYTHNEAGNNEDISATLSKIASQKPDFIVGPLYPGHFEAVSQFVKEKNIRLLNPFSSKMTQVTTNPQIFLVNAPESYKSIYVAELLGKTFAKENIIFFNADGTAPKGFGRQIQEQLTLQKVDFKNVAANAPVQQIVGLLKEGKKNVFISDAATESAVRGHLTKMTEIRQAAKGFETCLVGNDEWNEMASKFKLDFYKFDTYVITNNFLNVYSEYTQRFSDAYRQVYESDILDVTPSMLFLGYDVGSQLMNGVLKYGNQFNKQVVSTTNFQNDLRFRPTTDKGGYVNGSTLLIHYKPNQTIDKITQ